MKTRNGYDLTEADEATTRGYVTGRVIGLDLDVDNLAVEVARVLEEGFFKVWPLHETIDDDKLWFLAAETDFEPSEDL